MTDVSSPTAPGQLKHACVRPMQAGDLAQVQAIDRLSFALPWPASAFSYELQQNPASLLWVAEIRPQPSSMFVVGCIVVWVILDEAHIATLAVHPDYRGNGISRLLLAVGLREAHQKGCRSATLEVRIGNQVAQGLYHRFGFVEVGSRPRYYQDNHEDALILTLQRLDTAYLAWLAGSGWLNGAEQIPENQPGTNGGVR